MKLNLFLIFVLFTFLSFSQIGGRLKETKNQRKLKLNIRRSGWHDRRWVPNKLSKIEKDRKLFFRWTTPNQRSKEKIQKKINRDRARKRMRGRDSFTKRKYRR